MAETPLGSGDPVTESCKISAWWVCSTATKLGDTIGDKIISKVHTIGDTIF